MRIPKIRLSTPPPRGIKPAPLSPCEEAYKTVLTTLAAEGKVIWFAFHPIKIRLAVSYFFSPSALVQLEDGEVQIHDVYPHNTEKAVLLSPHARMAASLLPFTYKSIEINPRSPFDRKEYTVPRARTFPEGRKKLTIEG